MTARFRAQAQEKKNHILKKFGTKTSGGSQAKTYSQYTQLVGYMHTVWAHTLLLYTLTQEKQDHSVKTIIRNNNNVIQIRFSD